MYSEIMTAPLSSQTVKQCGMTSLCLLSLFITFGSKQQANTFCLCRGSSLYFFGQNTVLWTDLISWHGLQSCESCTFYFRKPYVLIKREFPLRRLPSQTGHRSTVIVWQVSCPLSSRHTMTPCHMHSRTTWVILAIAVGLGTVPYQVAWLSVL